MSDMMIYHRYGQDTHTDYKEYLLSIAQQIYEFVKAFWSYMEVEVIVSSGVDKNAQPWVTIDISSLDPQAKAIEIAKIVIVTFGFTVPMSWQVVDQRRVRIIMTKKPEI